MQTSEKLANPAVLGLTCFGLTTVLLNLHNAGLFGQDVAVLAMGIFLGGMAQIVAGIMEYKKANTFATTAFIAYGFFWLTLVFIIIFRPGLLAWQADGKALLALEQTNRGFAWYLALWGVFTLCMTIGTFRVNRVLQFTFVSLTVLFFLLAIHFAWFSGPGESDAVLKLAGMIGIVCGGSAIYLAQAELWNEMFGRTILPIWPVGARGAYKRPEDL
jgi:succinate-acetate transporter protein